MAGIRTLTIRDVEQALELSDAEGWNQTASDWKLLILHPGNICLAYESGGKIVGTAVAMNYSNKLAWIGMVLVHREYRGKGTGTVLVGKLLKRLKIYRCIKLDATPAGEPVYRKLGFRPDFPIYRMVSDKRFMEEGNREDVYSVGKIDFEMLTGTVQYEKEVLGVSRAHLIEYLLKNDSQYALSIRYQGKISGFVMGREGSRFYQIGPLLAESIEFARVLLLQVFELLSDRPVVLDVPADQGALIEWLQACGFKIQRTFLRMYFHKNVYPGDRKKQFLISGPEFG